VFTDPREGGVDDWLLGTTRDAVVAFRGAWSHESSVSMFKEVLAHSSQ
jgi:hypothetical protein